MDIESLIASAKKQYTPAKIPQPHSTTSEPAAGPSGLSEPFLPGPPVGAGEPPEAPKKGKGVARSIPDVPPKAPLRVSSRQATLKYASMNEAAMQKANTGEGVAAKPKASGGSRASTPRVVGVIGIRDEIAEALFDYDMRHAEEDIPSVAPLSTTIVRDENGYVDDDTALKILMGEIVCDLNDLVECGSNTDSELEEALLTAAATVKATPESETESLPESSESPDPNTSSDDKPSGDRPAKKRRNRRSRNRKRNRTSPKAPVVAATTPEAEPEAVWPVYVNPKLEPFFSPQAAARVQNGQYVMTPEEQKVFQARDRTRKSRVTTIDQSDYATCVRLFTTSFSRVTVPAQVLADSGADLGLCISETLAKDLDLTWTPGNSPLAGVAGTSYESRANEEIILRMGGDGRLLDVDTTPEGGCFEAKVRPHIMSAGMQSSIGHDCIMGQELLYRSLASFDMLREKMELSPAYHVRGCAQFRITIPCKMTVPRVEAALIAAFLPLTPDDQPYMSGYVVDRPSIVAATTDKPAPAKPAARPQPTRTARFAAVAASAVETVSRIISKPFTQAKRPPPTPFRRALTHKTEPRAAAPLHPGFPQESNFPTKEQYRTKRAQAATRNAAHRVEAKELLASSSHLVAPLPESQRLYKEALLNSVKPTHLAYSVEDLKRTGRLKDDGELELGDSTPTVVYNALSAEAAQRRSAQADLERRLAKIEAELVALRQTRTPARSAPLDSLHPDVKEIVPPINQTSVKPFIVNPTPGASRSEASRGTSPLNPHAKSYPAQAPVDAKGKAKAPPPPPKEPVSVPKDLQNHNQPLSIGSSPAEAHLSKGEAGWTKVEAKKPRKSRQLAPPVPSQHPMATRRSAAVPSTPQGGQAVASVVVPQGPHIPTDTAEWDHLRGRVHTRTKSPEPVAHRFPSNTKVTWHPDTDKIALVAVMTALTALPAAKAETILIPGSSSPLEDEGAFAAQVFAALVIWVAFIFSRYLAGKSEWVKRAVYAATTLCSSVWVQQLLNIRAPVATLWQSMIAKGWAAPTFWAAVVAGAFFTHVWFRRERLLFRKAHRL
jgi:hypothetical protein